MLFQIHLKKHDGVMDKCKCCQLSYSILSNLFRLVLCTLRGVLIWRSWVIFFDPRESSSFTLQLFVTAELFCHIAGGREVRWQIPANKDAVNPTVTMYQQKLFNSMHWIRNAVSGIYPDSAPSSKKTVLEEGTKELFKISLKKPYSSKCLWRKPIPQK